MIIRAVLYSPLRPASSGGVPFFERSFTNFESTDEIEQTGARQLAHILKDGKYVVPLGANSQLELTLPCDDLQKHLGSVDENMTLEMSGVLPEVTDELVSILHEDGWKILNASQFFDLHQVIPAHVH